MIASKELYNLFLYLNKNNYYFQKKFKKDDVNLTSFDFFQKTIDNITITTKFDIRDNYDEFITDDDDEIIEEFTSGSTGVPLRCVKTKNERIKLALTLWKARKELDQMVNANNFLSLFGHHTRRLLGDIFVFEEDNMSTCYHNLLKLKPRWINCSLTTIYKYAQLIERGIIDDCSSSIKYIELSGEYVDKEKQQYINKMLNCKSFSQYGLRECWCIAYQCEVGNLHIVDSVQVEVRNNHSYFDNYGEIVVTSIYNKKMPIIRYNTNDIGRISEQKCRCGRKTKVLELIGARKDDVLIGEKQMLGSLCIKRALNELIHEKIDIINAINVEQIAEKHFCVKIVKKRNYRDDYTQYLINALKNQLGKTSEFDIHFVEEIPLINGKTRIFTSMQTKE